MVSATRFVCHAATSTGNSGTVSPRSSGAMWSWPIALDIANHFEQRLEVLDGKAIALMNRTFWDKPGGLVVDYLGLAHELKAALATCTQSGGTGRTAIDQAEAVAVMKEKYEICCDLFHGFDWSRWKMGKPEERLALLPAAQEHILAQENGKERLLKAVSELSKAFALAVPAEEALAIRDDVAFFQAVAAALAKRASGGPRTEELDCAIRKIVFLVPSPATVL